MNTQTDVVTCVHGDEESFEKRIVAAKEKINRLTTDKAAAEKRVELIRRNREVLLIDNRDPDAELRAIAAEVRKTEAAIGLAKSELQKVCVEERDQLVEQENLAWAQLADEQVGLYRVTLANIVTALKELQVSLETLAKRREEVPEFAAKLDTELRRFDECVEKVGTGNLRFGPDGTLTAMLRRALDDCARRSGIREILDKMADAEKLRRELNEKAILAGLGLTDTPPFPKTEF